MNNVIQFEQYASRPELEISRKPMDPIKTLKALSVMAGEPETRYNAARRQKFLEILPDYLWQIAPRVTVVRSDSGLKFDSRDYEEQFCVGDSTITLLH